MAPAPSKRSSNTRYAAPTIFGLHTLPTLPILRIVLKESVVQLNEVHLLLRASPSNRRGSRELIRGATRSAIRKPAWEHLSRPKGRNLESDVEPSR